MKSQGDAEGQGRAAGRRDRGGGVSLAVWGTDSGSEDHGRTGGKEEPGGVRGVEGRGEAADSEVRAIATMGQNGARGMREPCGA